jgi:hypothetical protein
MRATQGGQSVDCHIFAIIRPRRCTFGRQAVRWDECSREEQHMHDQHRRPAPHAGAASAHATSGRAVATPRHAAFVGLGHCLVAGLGAGLASTLVLVTLVLALGALGR